MQDELLQFQKKIVWTLVEQSLNVNIIGTKWIFKNKINGQANIVKNKDQLMA